MKPILWIDTGAGISGDCFAAALESALSRAGVRGACADFTDCTLARGYFGDISDVLEALADSGQAQVVERGARALSI